MHESPHPKSGKFVTVNLGAGPHQAGYDKYLNGESRELGDWLDRIKLDERIGERALQIGIDFYVHRCFPRMPVHGNTMESIDTSDLVYCIHEIGPPDLKHIAIDILDGSEVE